MGDLLKQIDIDIKSDNTPRPKKIDYKPQFIVCHECGGHMIMASGCACCVDCGLSMCKG